MNNAGRGIFPPLRIWLFLFVAILFISASLSFLALRYTSLEFESRSEYLNHGFASAQGKTVVLAIGTSLLECGLDSSRKIEGLVEELSGRPITMLKIYKQGGTLSEIVDRMQTLHTLNPDLVVIEANMLFYRPVQEPFFYKCMYIYHLLIKKHSTWQPYLPDVEPRARAEWKTIDDLRNGLIQTTDIYSFRDLAASWQSKGTRFLFINFPVEKSEECRKWNRSDTSSFNANMKYLREKIRFNYFNAGLKLDSSFFNDYTHLNREGRSIFTKSFCTAVALQLKSL